MAVADEVIPRVELSAGPLFFLSDAHLGAEDAAAEARKHAVLARLVDRIIANRGSAVILGDLFDYGFSYPAHIPPGNVAGLGLLRRLREAGVRVLYFGGNHDCWYGAYLVREFGLEFFPDAAELSFAGLRCRVAHGDGLAANEHGYRLLRKVLRSPLSIALYRLIPPARGTALALWCSRWSRRQKPGRGADPEPLWQAARRYFADGYDAVVLGHAHVPALRTEQGKTYLNTGDLNMHFTYGIWQDGHWRLGDALTGDDFAPAGQ